MSGRVESKIGSGAWGQVYVYVEAVNGLHDYISAKLHLKTCNISIGSYFVTGERYFKHNLIFCAWS